MKCPKCGYISFDYSQVCAKCNKDISTEQEKMNIPPFRPDPPALLAALTGEANESQVGIPMGESGGFGTDEQQAGIAMDESGGISTDDVAFAESQEVEMDFEAEGTGELDATGETDSGAEDFSEDFAFDDGSGEEVTFDTGELSLEDTGMPSAGVDEEELGLDFDAIEEGAPAVDEDAEAADDSLELDLDALPDEAPAAAEEPMEIAGDEIDLDLDLDALPDEAPLEVEDTGTGEIGDGLDLDLDALPDEAPAGLEEVAEEAGAEEVAVDLDLDALPEAAPAAAGEETPGPADADLDFELDSIALDETEEPIPADEGGEMALDLDTSEPAETDFAPAEEGGQIELNIDDLKVNETGELEIGAPAAPAGEETSFDMDELSLDEALPGTEEVEQALAEEDDTTIDLDEIGLGDEPPPLESSGIEVDGDEIIDLDDLDIELDLGDSDDKSS